MIPTQFEYLGRWVDTKHFCAFVYSISEQKLAKSYQEFIDLIGSGLWFASKEDAEKAIFKDGDSLNIEVEQKKEKIVPYIAPTKCEALLRGEEINPSVLERLMEEPKSTRANAKNKFRAATSLGK